MLKKNEEFERLEAEAKQRAAEDEKHRELLKENLKAEAQEAEYMDKLDDAI